MPKRSDVADLLTTCRWWRREARRSAHDHTPPPGLLHHISLLPNLHDRLRCHAALRAS